MLEGLVEIPSLSSNTTLLVIILFLSLLLLGLIGFFVIWWTKFKITFVVRNITRDKLRIKIDKAREILIDGVRYLKLRRMKEIVPIPQDEAIDTTYNGKMFVEAYRNMNGEYCYVRDSADTSVFFQPLKTNTRIIHINQIKKAQLKKGFDWKEHLPLFVGIGFVMICFISWLIFGAEVYAPLTEAANVKNAELQIQRDIATTLQNVNNDLQRIEGGLKQAGVVAPDPPN